MIALHTDPAGFSAEDCARILAAVADAPTQAARLVNAVAGGERRRADLVWLDDLPGTDWVMDRLIGIVRRANREVFGFDLTDFAESPQVARYEAASGGHFGWHADIGDGPLAARRKLTLVAQLSLPEDYAGGALELQPSGEVHAAETARGSVTVFPSFVLHRVTPVTRGVRLSLTVWAHGPAFR